jgi:hypothetical protein
MKRYKRKFEEANANDAINKIFLGVNDMTQLYLGKTCAEYISKGIFKGLDYNQQTTVDNKENIIKELVNFLQKLKFKDK